MVSGTGLESSLEPTYEGLKREAPSLFPMSGHSGLEPTYEGLKHGVTPYHRGDCVVFGAYL